MTENVESKTALFDAIAVMGTGLVDDLNGAAIPKDGGGWGYGLILGMYHTAPADPPDLGQQAPPPGRQEVTGRAETRSPASLDRLRRGNVPHVC
jgi:hypothetical protein